MRTLTPALILAPFVLLVACGGDKDDDSATTSSGTTVGTTPAGAATGVASGTASGTPTELEDCTDGVDNDLDGLLDCEDDDCVSSSACLESDCTNGTDDDADGLVDCLDEDCWGNGCQVTIATLQTFGPVEVKAVSSWRTVYGDPSCAGSSSAFEGTITLPNPAGTVQHIPASGGTWTTCDWSASASEITMYSSSFASYAVPLPVSRTGFAIDPSCAIQDSSFLPQHWLLNVTGSTVDMRTRPSGNGPVWWTLNTFGPYYANSTSGSYQVDAGLCDSNVNTFQYTASWFDVTAGSPYTALDQ